MNVPYRGAPPAVTALIAGQVQVYFDPIPSSIGYIRAGKVRPLAITSATRSKVLPDLPTVSEFVPGYEASIWWGVGAPKATPAEIVDKLNKEINAALDDPKMKARLAGLGGVALPGSPAEFGKLIADDTEKSGQGHQNCRHQTGVGSTFHNAPIGEFDEPMSHTGHSGRFGPTAVRSAHASIAALTTDEVDGSRSRI